MMHSTKMKGWLLTGAVAVTAGALCAQTHTEGAHMAVSAADQSCLQLKDDNTWTTKASWISGVASVSTLDTVLANVNTDAVELTSSTHPPVIGYGNGVRFSTGDMGTNEWIPQGLALSVSPGGINYAVVSWHFNDDDYTTYNNGSRITIMNTNDLSTAKYRNIILVNPTGTNTYEPVKIHVGGLAIAGNYLYVADTSKGFRVFDLSAFRDVWGDPSCQQASGQGIFAASGTHWCADGYGYMLPQVGSYTMPSTKADGTAISAACKPKFSWAGKDTRPATNQILSGEYCNNDDQTCEGDATGLNGRLYQWPLASTNRLNTTNLYVSPTKVYFMNERNIQGVAPDMVAGAATDSYWLSATRYNGAIFKVTPAATAKKWIYSDSLAPWHPEGMHATTSSGHLWMITEGESTGATTWNTNPATGGRVLIYIQQSAVN